MRFLLPLLPLLLALSGMAAVAAEKPKQAKPAPAVSAENSAIPTTRFTLENGLKVVIVERHRAPAVAHILWVDTGSADDPRGKSGLSHYLEHMLFKGTEKISEERYNSEIEALGGEHNAFTNQDVTAYHVLVAKDKLREVMALESERFLHWHPKEDGYLSERGVILEERRLRIENQPSALLSEAMMAALYQNHPYHTPIIGWMNEMEGLTADDAKLWFKTYYQPKNTTLMLVGDITPEEAKSLAERYFGPWKNTADLPPRLWTEEPVRRSSNLVTLRNASVKQPLWRRYYDGPSLAYGKKDEVVPLMLLSEMLGADRTGILYKKLVKEQKLATAVDTGYGGFSRGPETFTVSIAPAPGVTLAKLTLAYDAAITEALNKNELTGDALTRAKTQMKAEMVFARDGLEGFAFVIAQLVMIGVPTSYFTDLPGIIDHVTLDQVKAAAKDVLVNRTASTGWLLPEGRSVATAPVTDLKAAEGAADVH